MASAGSSKSDMQDAAQAAARQALDECKERVFNCSEILKRDDDALLACNTVRAMFNEVTKNFNPQAPLSDAHSYFLNEGLPTCLVALIKRNPQHTDQAAIAVQDLFQAAVAFVAQSIKTCDFPLLYEITSRLLFDKYNAFYLHHSGPHYSHSSTAANGSKLRVVTRTPNANDDTPSFLLDNINVFHTLHGFANAVERLRLSVANKKHFLSLGSLRALLLLLSRPANHLDSAFATNLAHKIVPLVSSFILALSEDQLKVEDKQSLARVRLVFTDLVHSTLPFNEAAETAERFALELANRCFRSSIMDKRVFAMSEFREHIQNVYIAQDIARADARQRQYQLQNPHHRPMQPQQPAREPPVFWLTPQHLVQFVRDNDLLTHMFRDHVHTEVVRRSVDILRLLASTNSLTTADLDLVWGSMEGQHESYQHVLFSVLGELPGDLQPDQVDHLFYNRIAKLTTESYDLQTLQLVNRITTDAFSPGLDQPVSNHSYGLDIFWTLVQDDTAVSSDLAHHARRMLSNALELRGARPFATLFLQRCLDNVRRHTTVYDSLLVMMKIFSSFPVTSAHTQQRLRNVTASSGGAPSPSSSSLDAAATAATAAANTSAADAALDTHLDLDNPDRVPTVAEVIASFLKANNFLDLLFEDLVHFKEHALPEFFRIGMLNGRETDRSARVALAKMHPLICRDYYGVHLAGRLEFLAFIIGQSTLEFPVQLTPSNAEALWNSCVIDAFTEEEQEKCVLWFESQLSGRANALSTDVLEHLFRVCVPNMDFRHVIGVTYRLVQKMFIRVNRRANHYREPDHYGGEPLVLSPNLIGLEQIWMFALSATDETVAKDSSTLLIQLYLNLAPDNFNSDQVRERRKEFVEESMRRLAAAWAAEQSDPAAAQEHSYFIERSLKLIRLFLETFSHKHARELAESNTVRHGARARGNPIRLVFSLTSTSMVRHKLEFYSNDTFGDALAQASIELRRRMNRTNGSFRFVCKGKDCMREWETRTLAEVGVVDEEVIQTMYLSPSTTAASRDVMEVTSAGVVRPVTKDTSMSDDNTPPTTPPVADGVKDGDIPTEPTMSEMVIDEPPSAIPMRMLSQANHFDQLFALLRHPRDGLAQVAWEIIMQLPTNRAMLERLRALPDNPEDPTTGWSALLDGASTFKLLYCLQIVESLAQAKGETNSVCSAWRTRFEERGGVHHLVHLLRTGEAVRLTSAAGSSMGTIDRQLRRSCLRLLLKLLGTFSFRADYADDRDASSARTVQELPLRPGCALSSLSGDEPFVHLLMSVAEMNLASMLSLPDRAVKATVLHQRQVSDSNDVLPMDLDVVDGPQIGPLLPSPVPDDDDDTNGAVDSTVVNLGELGQQGVCGQTMALIVGLCLSSVRELQAFCAQPKLAQWLHAVLLSGDEDTRMQVSWALRALWKRLPIAAAMVVVEGDAGQGDPADSSATTTTAVNQRMLDMVNVLSRQLIDFLPLVEEGTAADSCEQYFSLLCDLVAEHADPQESQRLCQQAAAAIRRRPVLERNDQTVQDHVLCGLFYFLETLLRRSPTSSKVHVGQQLRVLDDLFDRCLFDIPTVENHGPSGPPVCKHETTRRAAFSLLKTLIVGSPDNFRLLYSRLCAHHSRAMRSVGWYYSVQFQQRASSGYVGLQNQGATCYMNSLLQQFFMVPAFRRGLLAAKPANPDEDKGDSLLYQLQRLYSHLLESEKRAYDTRSFCNAVKDYDGQPMNCAVQMDVDEFFNMLFDRLENAIEPSRRDLFKYHFGGKLVQQVISRDCDHISEREEPYFAIQCDVKNKKSLLESLALYCEGEMLDGDNKYHCSKCDRKVAALKRACVQTLPRTLIVHLKRFEFDFDTLRRYKINDHIEFPEVLDMEPYTLVGIQRRDAEAAASAAAHAVGSAQGEPDPVAVARAQTTAAALAALPVAKGDTRFKLSGILVHTGTADSGHYYSFVREREPRFPGQPLSWYQFNDSTVEEFDADFIADQCYGGVQSLEQWDQMQQKMVSQWAPKPYSAYMLFYERIDDTPAPATVPSDEATMSVDDTVNPLNLTPEQAAPLDPTIRESIWKQNMAFWRDTHVFDSAYSGFLRDMLRSSITPTPESISAAVVAAFGDDGDAASAQANLDKVVSDGEDCMKDISTAYERPPSGDLMWDDGRPFDVMLYKIKLATYYVVETLAVSKDRTILALGEWVSMLEKYYARHLPACLWFLEMMTDENGAWIRHMFLNCSVADVRDHFLSLVNHVVSLVRPSEVTWYHETEQVEERDEETKSIVVKTRPRSLIMRFMAAVLACVPEAPPHWRSLDQFLLLIHKLHQQGIEEQYALLHLGAVRILVDFFLERDSPLYALRTAEEQAKVTVMGDKFTSVELKPIAEVVCELALVLLKHERLIKQFRSANAAADTAIATENSCANNNNNNNNIDESDHDGATVEYDAGCTDMDTSSMDDKTATADSKNNNNKSSAAPSSIKSPAGGAGTGHVVVSESGGFLVEEDEQSSVVQGAAPSSASPAKVMVKSHESTVAEAVAAAAWRNGADDARLVTELEMQLLFGGTLEFFTKCLKEQYCDKDLEKIFQIISHNNLEVSQLIMTGMSEALNEEHVENLKWLVDVVLHWLLFTVDDVVGARMELAVAQLIRVVTVNLDQGKLAQEMMKILQRLVEDSVEASATLFKLHDQWLFPWLVAPDRILARSGADLIVTAYVTACKKHDAVGTVEEVRTRHGFKTAAHRYALWRSMLIQMLAEKMAQMRMPWITTDGTLRGERISIFHMQHLFRSLRKVLLTNDERRSFGAKYFDELWRLYECIDAQQNESDENKAELLFLWLSCAEQKLDEFIKPITESPAHTNRLIRSFISHNTAEKSVKYNDRVSSRFYKIVLILCESSMAFTLAWVEHNNCNWAFDYLLFTSVYSGLSDAMYALALYLAKTAAPVRQYLISKMVAAEWVSRQTTRFVALMEVCVTGIDEAGLFFSSGGYKALLAIVQMMKDPCRDTATLNGLIGVIQTMTNVLGRLTNNTLMTERPKQLQVYLDNTAKNWNHRRFVIQSLMSVLNTHTQTELREVVVELLEVMIQVDASALRDVIEVARQAHTRFYRAMRYGMTRRERRRLYRMRNEDEEEEDEDDDDDDDDDNDDQEDGEDEEEDENEGGAKGVVQAERDNARVLFLQIKAKLTGGRWGTAPMDSQRMRGRELSSPYTQLCMHVARPFLNAPRGEDVEVDTVTDRQFRSYYSLLLSACSNAFSCVAELHQPALQLWTAMLNESLHVGLEERMAPLIALRQSPLVANWDQVVHELVAMPAFEQFFVSAVSTERMALVTGHTLDDHDQMQLERERSEKILNEINTTWLRSLTPLVSQTCTSLGSVAEEVMSSALNCSLRLADLFGQGHRVDDEERLQPEEEEDDDDENDDNEDNNATGNERNGVPTDEEEWRLTLPAMTILRTSEQLLADLNALWILYAGASYNEPLMVAFATVEDCLAAVQPALASPWAQDLPRIRWLTLVLNQLLNEAMGPAGGDGGGGVDGGDATAVGGGEADGAEEAVATGGADETTL